MPRLLPAGELPLGLRFSAAEGFALSLVDFPVHGLGKLAVTAYASSRPAQPEFLGSGWHLPLDRIVAEVRRTEGRARLFLGAEEVTLRQKGWSGPEEVEFEAPPGFQTIVFRPQEDRWRVEGTDGKERIFDTVTKGAGPRIWYLSEVRWGEGARFRYGYHQGRVTQLMELRDAQGYCARFEHSPLRGNSSKVLLRAISVEGPKRSTVGRLQLCYALEQSTAGHEPLLQSVFVREQGDSPRGLRCMFDYFPRRRSGPRLLRSISQEPRAAQLFVPGLGRGAPWPHGEVHLPAKNLVAMRFWHEEPLTMVAEQEENAERVAVRLSLYARTHTQAEDQICYPDCQADWEQTSCFLTREQVVVATPNRLKPGCFEVFLWNWSEGFRQWRVHHRTLEATSLEVLGATEDGLGLRVARQDDPHTRYQYHWFDRAGAWCLTSMMPSSAPPVNLKRGGLVTSGEQEQESLFSRRMVPGALKTAAAKRVFREDEIDWQPDELFAGCGDGDGLALGS